THAQQGRAADESGEMSVELALRDRQVRSTGQRQRFAERGHDGPSPTSAMTARATWSVGGEPPAGRESPRAGTAQLLAGVSWSRTKRCNTCSISTRTRALT